MSIPKYQDESAFPRPHQLRLNSDEEQDVLLPAQWGLTKREYFAAMAMQGLLACPHQMCNDITNQTGLAVEYADKLLAELAK